MKKLHKDLLIYIETEVQFDSLKPLLFRLKDHTKTSFDIVVPSTVSKDEVNTDVYEGGARAIKKNGFNVVRSVGATTVPDIIINTEYKVLLSAYVYHWQYENINAKYRIMFPYASYYLNKPNWTIGNFITQDYLADALLSHAVGTQSVTDVFTRTHIVPSLKLMDYRKNIKKHKKDKPVLFFAPTYNEIDFAVRFLENIDEIKKKYTVIMRGHHRTHHIKGDADISMQLYKKADKIYDVDEHSIVIPLEEADIVVSDNSAVIFDAIYCNIPVALFSKNPNAFRYKNINTAQSDLVESGSVLWTDDPKKILKIVDRTMTPEFMKVQLQMQKTLFPNEFTGDLVKTWVDVLTAYIEDKLPHDYFFAKKYWVGYIQSGVVNTVQNQELQNEINNQTVLIEEYNKKIKLEQSPGVKTALKRLVKACFYKLGLIERS